MISSALMRFSGAAIWAPFAIALCASTPANAGVFSVTPVRIYMSVKDRAVAVTVTNDGDSAIVLQADLNVWTQKADGADELTLTDDLILSPPIIKLAPKARQVVRLARLAPPDASRQLSYRFILREIPEATPSGDVQVPIALALSMPVFITPPGVKRNLECKVADRSAGGIAVQCANSGSAYAQIREFVIMRGEQRIARFEGGAYILPGAAKTIAVGTEAAATPGDARLVVTFDDNQTQQFQLSLP